MLIAGPTTVLSTRREKVIVPMKFKDEALSLTCEWNECQFNSNVLNVFMDHVVKHIPSIEMKYVTEEVKAEPGVSRMIVQLVCDWTSCPYRASQAEDLQRHLYLHAYHTKLKCIGSNTISRNSLNPCRADSSNRNILPDLSENVVCAWGNCSQKFINIQEYYDHILVHCNRNPKGKNVPGGISCCWAGCQNKFPNINKLRDHMRSHTQEKLLACPTCGGLFSNRTRFFDHCQRQVEDEDEDQVFGCSVCFKSFPTIRLLRDHIRVHVNTYRCTMCDMSCSSPSALRSHVRYRHATGRPFPCDECSHAAKTLNDLQRHKKAHKQTVYCCEEAGCNYSAKSQSAFNFHWQNVHNNESKEQKYVCHICEKRFKRGYYLTKHLIGTHKLQWPSGHSRFRYKICADGLYRLQTLRYETAEDGDGDEETEDGAMKVDPLSASSV